MPNNLTDAEETRLLDLSALDGDLLALMTTLGTDAAAGTEAAGGSYARQVIDWAAASAGSKSTAAGITFTGMNASEVQGWAVYNAAGTSRKWYGLFSPQKGTAQNTGDTITITGHGYVDGDKVVFQDGYAPTGLSANVTYFVRDSLANTFKVSATLGGAAVAVTADTAEVWVGKVLTVPAGAGVSLAAGALSVSLS